MTEYRAYFSPDVETMPYEQVELLQQEKLRRQVKYLAERSPFYVKKLREAGIEPGDIRTCGDLAKVPFTTKDEIRQSQIDAPPFGSHFAADLSSIVRVYASSGTTGRPTYVAVTERDRNIWTTVSARGYWSRGIRPNDIVVHGMGLTFFVGGLPTVDALTAIGCAMVPVGTGATDRLIMSIQHLKATVLLATPSYAIYLAEHVRDRFGFEAEALGIRLVSVGAEPGGGIPSIRRKIEESWGAPCREGLGNADAMATAFAECPEGNGMHFHGQEFLITEIIDPETGAALDPKEGLEGELVYTSIDREATPVLRFRTRDRVKIWTDPCPCGRTSFRLRCIGRTDDMLIVRGVNVFPSAIRDVVTQFRPETTGEIQVLLPEPGPKVEPPVHVTVETGENWSGSAHELRQRVEEELRNKLIFRAKVELVPAKSLPRFEGKGKLVRVLSAER